MVDFGVPRNRWLCPSDRELALRARLNTGWSVKTSVLNSYVKPQQISDVEIEKVIKVLKRAECVEHVEKERVGRLVERLENMKKNAMGNGVSQCVLCADRFGILGASPLPCNDCCKAVCTTCGVDTVNAQSEPLWLCKICAETREMWKKSGAWFLRKLPEYILPKKKIEQSKYRPRNMPAEDLRISPHTQRAIHTWSQRKEGAAKESTDSSDEDIKMMNVNHNSREVCKSTESDDGSDSETCTVRTVINTWSSQNILATVDSASTSEESSKSSHIEQLDNRSENSRFTLTVDCYDVQDIGTPSICDSLESEYSSTACSTVESGISSVNITEEDPVIMKPYCRQGSQVSVFSSLSSSSTGNGSHSSLNTSFDKLSVDGNRSQDGKPSKRTSKIMRRLKQTIMKPHK